MVSGDVRWKRRIIVINLYHYIMSEGEMDLNSKRERRLGVLSIEISLPPPLLVDPNHGRSTGELTRGGIDHNCG